MTEPKERDAETAARTSPVVVAYRAMLAAWDEARRRAGGALGQEDESDWTCALHTVWRAFTEEEREVYERWRDRCKLEKLA